MTVVQRLLLAADLLALILLLGLARGIARMFLPPDAPTPPGEFAQLALLFSGPPLLLIAGGLGAALRWRRRQSATVLLALPPALVAAGVLLMLGASL